MRDEANSDAPAVTAPGLRRGLSVIGAVAVAALWSASAAAQTPSPFAYWQNSAGIVLAPLAGPVPDWRVDVGAGVAVMPIYEGSDRYHLLPAPALDVRYRDIAFLSTGDGLGVNLFHGQTYRAGIALAYDLGRNQNGSHRLQGLGDVDTAPEIKLFAEWALLPFVISVDVRRAIGGSNGYVGDIGAYMPVIGTEKLVVFVGPSVTVADRRSIEANFGVTPAQAMPHSEFPIYQAHGGLRNTNFGIDAVYHFTEHWFLNGDAAVERLIGSAGESPIAQAKDQLAASLILGYEF